MMTHNTASGRENSDIDADAATVLAEIEEMKQRLALLEARLPPCTPAEPPGRRQKEAALFKKTVLKLAAGAGLGVLAGASLVYGSSAVQSAVEALTITPDGKVGIGTPSPSAKLDVAGDAHIAGPIGIGTADPAARLDVVGGLLHVAGTTSPTVNSQGAYLGWNALTGGTGETDFINNRGGGAGGFAFMNSEPSGNPKSTLMFLAGDGNVGIGTTDPKSKLDVDGAAQLKSLTVNGAAQLKSLTVPGVDKEQKPAAAVQIEGTNGRNTFIDSEQVGPLRVGAAWGIPGIYSEKGDVVVGSQSGIIQLRGKVMGEVVYQRDDEAQTTYQKPMWRYHMSLTAAKYAGRTKTIPNDILSAFCATRDGCEVRLGMTRWDDANKTQTASVVNRLYIGTDGRWRVNWPRDTEGRIAKGNSQDVMNAWDTCKLTDGTYENYQDKGDQQTGLQLLVWNGNGNPNPARTCELTIIP
jgi:hypothetical protein